MSAGLLTMFVQIRQQDDQKLAFQQSQFESYRKILIQHDIPASATGAQEFLRQVLPSKTMTLKIKSCIQDLSGRKYEDRVNAERKLATMGPVALQLLKQAAMQGDPETQMRANRAVKAIGKYTGVLLNASINVLIYDPADKPALEDRLETLFELCRKADGLSIDSELKQAIIFIAAPNVKDKILTGVQDENSLLANTCIRALTKCLTKQELGKYVNLLQSDEALDSLAAIESFGFLDPTRSIDLIISRHLNSQDRQVRVISINLLRAVTMHSFGYDVDGNSKEKKQAIQRWENWFAKNKPISMECFERMVAAANDAPKGFLISVNGTGVRKYDFEGELQWKLDGNTYDAQQVDLDLVLITFRNDGEVRLIRDGQTIRTVSNLKSPSDAEYLPNGNILVAHGTGKITEHDSTGQTVNEFEGFSNPFDCDRLPNGNTLVADSNNNRIVEVDSTGHVIWECGGLKFPNNVFRLPDGRTLYTTYTSGIVALLGIDGTEQWSYKIKNGTLYSVYCAKGKIYVADGANRKIWVLGMTGELVHGVSIPETFCDVSFPTE